MTIVSYNQRLRDLAAADPDRIAITCGDQHITRAELVRRGEDLAAQFHDAGVGVGDMVTIAVPNSIDWFVAYVATWRLGAIPQPISHRLPQREFEAILELAEPKVVVGVAEGSLDGRLCIPLGHRAPVVGDAARPALPDEVSPAWKAPT